MFHKIQVLYTLYTTRLEGVDVYQKNDPPLDSMLDKLCFFDSTELLSLIWSKISWTPLMTDFC